MAKIKQIICISLVLLFFDAQAQKIAVGAERTDSYLTYLKDKKVGIVGIGGLGHMAIKIAKAADAIIPKPTVLIGIGLPLIISITAKAAFKSPPLELIITCKYFGFGFSKFFAIIKEIKSLQLSSVTELINKYISFSSGVGVVVVSGGLLVIMGVLS